MITETQLINLGFSVKERSSWQPGFQSHGEVYTKDGLTIEGFDCKGGKTFQDLSGQIKFNSLKELDQYFIGARKKSIFI